MDFAEETIRAGWREWAALAWAGLLDSGPGALFIDLAFDEQLQVRADAQYFSQAAMVRPACERLFISPVFTLDFFALSLAVASYDPLREVVFLIREPDFNSRILTRALAPSPGEAFIDQIGQRPANVAKATLTN